MASACPPVSLSLSLSENRLLTSSSQVGAMIIEVSYGVEALPKNDPFIDTAEKGLSTVAQCLPGAFLVDTLPILKIVPSWMPGASFKRKAKLWREYADEMLEAPFRALKADIVSASLPRSCEELIDTP